MQFILKKTRRRSDAPDYIFAPVKDFCAFADKIRNGRFFHAGEAIMVNGITTIISRSAIPEKLAEVTDRSSENKQLATTVVVQQEAEKAVKTVQKAEHIAAVNPVRARKEKEEREKKKKKQAQDGQPGSHLDLEA